MEGLALQLPAFHQAHAPTQEELLSTVRARASSAKPGLIYHLSEMMSTMNSLLLANETKSLLLILQWYREECSASSGKGVWSRLLGQAILTAFPAIHSAGDLVTFLLTEGCSKPRPCPCESHLPLHYRRLLSPAYEAPALPLTCLYSLWLTHWSCKLFPQLLTCQIPVRPSRLYSLP